MVGGLALIGLLVGLILFVNQPVHSMSEGMNPMGIVAFCSLGASVGCLLADRKGSER
jgi:hypothetical protein